MKEATSNPSGDVQLVSCLVVEIDSFIDEIMSRYRMMIEGGGEDGAELLVLTSNLVACSHGLDARYCIVDSSPDSGGGRGVFARSSIPEGTIICSENPISIHQNISYLAHLDSLLSSQPLPLSVALLLHPASDSPETRSAVLSSNQTLSDTARMMSENGKLPRETILRLLKLSGRFRLCSDSLKGSGLNVQTAFEHEAGKILAWLFSVMQRNIIQIPSLCGHFGIRSVWLCLFINLFSLPITVICSTSICRKLG